MVLTVKNSDRSSPWPALSAWTSEFDQLFNEMNHMISPFRRTSRGEPVHSMPCDIFETESSYLLSLDVPGVKSDDISVDTKGNVLTVHAKRHKQTPAGVSEHSYRIERTFGEITRSFTLPKDIAAEKIKASLDQGTLHLMVPKSEKAKPNKIKVSAGKADFFGEFESNGSNSTVTGTSRNV